MTNFDCFDSSTYVYDHFWVVAGPNPYNLHICNIIFEMPTSLDSVTIIGHNFD